MQLSPASSVRRSALARDAAALYEVMTELLRVYQFRDREHLGYHGLTITQCYVLDIVIKRGPMTLNEIAAEMNLDKSTLSRVMDGLQRKGAVKRAPNPADGRSTLIEATRSGVQRYERVVADIVAENEKLLSTFPGAARRQLVELIGMLATAARQRHIEPAD